MAYYLCDLLKRQGTKAEQESKNMRGVRIPLNYDPEKDKRRKRSERV